MKTRIMGLSALILLVAVYLADRKVKPGTVDETAPSEEKQNRRSTSRPSRVSGFASSSGVRIDRIFEMRNPVSAMNLAALKKYEAELMVDGMPPPRDYLMHMRFWGFSSGKEAFEHSLKVGEKVPYRWRSDLGRNGKIGLATLAAFQGWLEGETAEALVFLDELAVELGEGHPGLTTLEIGALTERLRWDESTGLEKAHGLLGDKRKGKEVIGMVAAHLIQEERSGEFSRWVEKFDELAWENQKDYESLLTPALEVLTKLDRMWVRDFFEGYATSFQESAGRGSDPLKYALKNYLMSALQSDGHEQTERWIAELPDCELKQICESEMTQLKERK